MKFIDYNITDMESEYAFSKRKINDALERCNLQQAVQECYAWAKVIADKLGFSFRDNWKLFKKIWSRIISEKRLWRALT